MGTYKILEMESGSKSHGKKSDKKIKFHEEEVKDHEEGHVIREADTKFKPPTDEVDMAVDDDADLDQKLIEASKNAEENILRSSTKDITED